MKPFQSFALACIYIALIIFTNTACTEEEPGPTPINPDDLRYEGNWLGNTSQTKLISFEVENSVDAPIIQHCKIGYLEDSNYYQLKLSNPAGLSKITDGAFSFQLPDGGDISGDFISTDLCEGRFSPIDKNTGQKIHYHFSVITDTTQIDLLSTSRTSFSVGDFDYNYQQDFDFYFPFSRNTITDTGIIVTSSFNRKYGTINHGFPLIEIRAGHIQTTEDIHQLFSPGEKSFSKNAGEGFEIIFYNPEEYYIPYTTSAVDGNQEGSKLEILDITTVETYDATYKLFKFSARFNCKTYRLWGPTLVLDDGFYIGYIDTRN